MRKIIIVSIMALMLLTGCSSEEFNPYVAQVSNVLEPGTSIDPLTLIKDVEEAGLQFEVKESNLNAEVPGNYSVTYIVKSSNGRKSVEKTFYFDVKDYDAPVISVAESINITTGTIFSITDYVTAVDAREGDLTSAIAYEGSINTFKAGTYPITISVADSYGNTATAEVNVVVKAGSDSDLKSALVGSFTDKTYESSNTPSVIFSSDNSFNMTVYDGTKLVTISGTYKQVENQVYLLANNYTFSTSAEYNFCKFTIQADGTLMLNSSFDVYAPNQGDIFAR